MILSSLLLLPLIAMGLVVLSPNRKILKISAIGSSISQFLLSTLLWLKFDNYESGFQFVENYNWLPQAGIRFLLGVDGISIWLVLLTTFFLPLLLINHFKQEPFHRALGYKEKIFPACLFALQGCLLGVFLSLDLVVFYIFWELTLVPTYLLLGIWGGSRRIYAGTKFFLFTAIGSLFMLVAIIYMMLLHQEQFGVLSSSLFDLYRVDLPFTGDLISTQGVLFFAFFIAFAVKTPLFPLHTWLPDAHVEAPTAGSVLLAAVMLKLGTYAFIRYLVPLFPQASIYWSPWVVILGVIGVFYGAMMALVQNDMKKLIAYSSISHMGFVVAGIFSLNEVGVQGALFQMLSHGVVSGALFLSVGIVSERAKNRDIDKLGGLSNKMPMFALVFFILSLASIGLPLTSGFIGEFLILKGIFYKYESLTYFAVLGVVLGAAYMLWLFQRIFWGKESELIRNLVGSDNFDLKKVELVVFVPLIFVILLMGLGPNLFLKPARPSLNDWSTHFASKNINALGLGRKNE